MSRTRRKVPAGVRKCDAEFIRQIERGQISIPVSDGNFIGERWGEDAKRFVKRTKTRKDRRKNKAIEEE
jgi:hypothetical protein